MGLGWPYQPIYCLLILAKSSVAVLPPVIEVSPIADLNPHWQTTFTLRCKTTDWPGTPLYFWKRNGETLYPYDDLKIAFSSDKQSLIFKDTTLQQSGIYSCISTEFTEYLFEASEAVEVNIQEPPHIPSELALVNKSSTSVILKWTPQGTVPASLYTVTMWPGNFAYSSYQPMINLSNLRPYTIYKFGVEAMNSVGSRGSSNQLQIRTDPDKPSGVLDFSIGVRTATTLHLSWSTPGSSIVNDVLTGYTLTLHDTEENTLLQTHNYSDNITSTILEFLTPQTRYTISMAFLTRCCVSSSVSKDAETVSEGQTVAPTVQPYTESNTAPLNNTTVIGIVVGILIVVLILSSVVSLLCYRRRRADTPHNKPSNRWNDGTQDGANDLIPVSPPPEYTSQAQTDNASSNAQNASISRSFCFNAETTSPPPAYHSRSSSNNNSSISSLSNVGDPGEIEEIKESNLPPSSVRSSAPQRTTTLGLSSAHRLPPSAQGASRDTWI